MKKQQFNPEEYAKLKHRVEALQSRIKLDYGPATPERETARRLLIKLQKKLENYEETHDIPDQEIKDYSTSSNFNVKDFFRDYPVHNSTSQTHHSQSEWNPDTDLRWKFHFGDDDDNYYEDIRSEAEMIDDLGILYAIFGSTYQTVENYHVYKIRFKKQTDTDGAFCQAYCDIYEDDIRICNDVIIAFWPFHIGDERCGSMGFSIPDIKKSVKKYQNGYSGLYIRILDELKDIWNIYFDNQTDTPMIPMITGDVLAYLESSDQSSYNNKPKVQLNKKQRERIIKDLERDINSGKMKHLESKALRMAVTAYKPYKNLSSFLEESGVVYKVDTSGVYIWKPRKRNNFGKLVGFEYCKSDYNYYLYLI